VPETLTNVRKALVSVSRNRGSFFSLVDEPVHRRSVGGLFNFLLFS
jgi:hypothetical protein